MPKLYAPYIVACTSHIKQEFNTSVLDKLFPNLKEKHTINPVYKDMSYPRTRTILIDTDKLPVRKANNNLFEKIVRKWQDNTVHAFLTDYSGLSEEDKLKEFYDVFKIPKASGGYRTLEAPKGLLKENMYYVLDLLKLFGAVYHDCAYAYIPKRDCRKALQRHLDNKSCWFLKLDLKDFFGSINPEFLEKSLNQLLVFNEAYLNSELKETFFKTIKEIAFLNNKLPQGTPLSPILTNMLMVPIDHAIRQALPKEYIYTRYADDLLISKRTDFSNDKESIVNTIKDILKDTPLKINDTKTRYGSKNGKNFNLGIMYNKDMCLTVGHRRKRKLKAMVHAYMTSDPTLEDTRSLAGELSYLHNIEPDYYRKIIVYFNNKYKCDIMNILHTNLKNL